LETCLAIPPLDPDAVNLGRAEWLTAIEAILTGCFAMTNEDVDGLTMGADFGAGKHEL
jgi:hypothetical protein